MELAAHRRRRKARLVLLGLAFVLFVLARCGPIVAYSAISGSVVDSATNQPAAGAVVVARWELQSIEPSALDTFRVEEAVTDATGAFTIPRWGPVVNWRFLYTGLRSNDPELILFKNGFQPAFERNNRSAAPQWFYRTADELDGRTFALRPFEGTTEAYLDACLDVEARIRRQVAGERCGWKRIPRLILELNKVGVAATEAGVDGRKDSGQRLRRPEEIF